MGIILIYMYFIAGLALGYWGYYKLEPYFCDYVLAWPIAFIWILSCSGFIPLCLCALTFKAY